MVGPGGELKTGSGYRPVMQYDDVIAAMFQPSPEGAVVEPTVDASPARRLRDAIEPVAMHSVWSRLTNERLADLGLNFMTSYVWSRAALLGEPDRGVVASAFAVFEPTMIGDAYEAGRAACGRDVLLATRDEATIESLTVTLGDIDLESAGSIANAMLVALATVDGAGRPLFAGLRNQTIPAGPVGRLWRACELAREYRGDSHVAVCTAAGLTAVEMNVLTELWLGMPMATYSASRAWTVDQLDTAADGLRRRGWLDGDDLTAAGRTARDEIEERTDSLVDELVSAFDALPGGFDQSIEHLAAWSQVCVEAQAFPPDAYKRAAG